MTTKYATLLLSLTAMAALSASATEITISGTELSDLKYSPTGGTAQYNAGPPPTANLYTADSGLTGGAPAVFVEPTYNGNPLSLPSLGQLGNFSASYDLYSSSGGNGNAPYWLTYLVDPYGGDIGVVSFGGPDLDGSSQIHVFYDYSTDPQSSDTYWGDTLSQLDSTAYGTTTFGDLQVLETAVEIGDWDNGGLTVPASADIESITIGSSVPDGAPALLLLGIGLAGLGAMSLRKNRLSAAK